MGGLYNVREHDNARSSRVNVEDDDVGGEKSHDEIVVKEKVFGEEVAIIVEERVNDSSVAEMLEVADVSDPSVKPSIEDTTGMEVPSTKGLGVDVNPSIEDMLEGLKVSAPTWGDVLEPTVDDSGKVLVVEGIDVDVPPVVDTEPLTAKAVDGGVLLNVTHICVETADIQEVTHEDVAQKKNSKKRKHKKVIELGETSKPKKKLSKEERAAKRARKAERKARRAA
ncbi:hypothetical protein LIER_08850 [Lithospermum erythrorhizon]|uniref:Uncharacterized protein n=1 Tax=Lithospermum erythrorhizon TaxID=34254 RepID=A0AAV3PFN9_LITER